MGGGGTEVTMPDWLSGALEKYMTSGLERADQFGGAGGEAVGGQFWGNNARNVLGPSSPELRALDMYRNLGQVGMADLNQARTLQQRAMRDNEAQKLGLGLLTGEGKQSNLKKSFSLFDKAGQIAKEQVTGKNLGIDPAIAAANSRFATAMLPMIQSQGALQGIGRSTSLTNAMAAQQANTLMPLMQGGLEREERGIDRRYQDAMGRGSQLYNMDMNRGGSLLSAGNEKSNRQMQGAGFRLNLADTLYGRKQQQAQGLMQQGQNIRGIKQGQQDAQFNDLMRRFGAYENALNGPMSMVSGMMGSRSSKF